MSDKDKAESQVIEELSGMNDVLESEGFNSALFEHNPIETVVVDLEGKVIRFNKEMVKTGDRLPRIGDVMYVDYAGKHEIDMRNNLMECIRTEKPKEFPELKYKDKYLFVKMSPFSEGAIITCQDITKHKRAEHQQELVIQVLELLNRSGEGTDTIYDILLLIKNFTGFEAAGIRLKEGEDCPYYEISGFPADFVGAERYLCARDGTGQIIRDAEGNTYLECMCGNIICERTDLSLSCFTEGGSFWTNCTTEFLASTTDKERQTRTRNRCNTAGYESMALIPLRSDKEIIGLLQLNDKRKDMFTLETIRFFERIGSSIGIALSRKKREEQIKASLDEKRVLLKEIHHRVKNNLQIISSLLYLHSEHIKDKQSIKIFKESDDQIMSIALVHEHLYQSENPSSVNFDRYINDLLGYLLSSYGAQAGTIRLKTEIDDIELGVNTVIPCGLIVNELVSNSIKHAFPKGYTRERGNNSVHEIRIEFRKNEEERFTLTVSDNGIGLPEDIDVDKTESMGFYLVHMLVKQLKGTINLDRSRGTGFTITFKKSENSGKS